MSGNEFLKPTMQSQAKIDQSIEDCWESILECGGSDIPRVTYDALDYDDIVNMSERQIRLMVKLATLGHLVVCNSKMGSGIDDE